MKRSEIVNILVKMTSSHKLLWKKGVLDGFTTEYRKTTINVYYKYNITPDIVDKLATAELSLGDVSIDGNNVVFYISLNGIKFYSDVSIQALLSVINENYSISEQKYLDTLYSDLFGNNCDA